MLRKRGFFGDKNAQTILDISPLKKNKVLKIFVVLIALLLVVGSSVVFFNTKQASFNDEFDSATRQARICLQNAVKDAVITVGRNAGSLSISRIHSQTGSTPVNYLFSNGRSSLPSADQLQLSLSSAAQQEMRDSVSTCLTARIPEGIEVTWDSIAVSVQTGKSLKAQLTTPLLVQSSLFGRELDSIAVGIPLDVTSMMVPVSTIITRVSQGTDPSLIQVPGYVITSQQIGTDTIFVVKDSRQNIDGEPYTWAFAVQ